LRNVIRRAALIASDTIAPKHLDGSLDQNVSPVIPFPGKAASALSLRHKIQNQTRMIERDAVVGALEQAKGNKTEAARLLGIDYKTYRMKLKELG
jgi:two-component system nitrogen regulation response regulator GlnG